MRPGSPPISHPQEKEALLALERRYREITGGAGFSRASAALREVMNAFLP